MGINICLYKNGEDHPDWDYLREGNDKNFPSLIDWGVIVYQKGSSYWDDRQHFRPTDIDALKQRVISTGWYDIERYLHLISLLENDEDCWLYFSC